MGVLFEFLNVINLYLEMLASPFVDFTLKTLCVGMKCFAGLGVWEDRESSLHQKLDYALVTIYMLRGIFGLCTSVLSRKPTIPRFPNQHF